MVHDVSKEGQLGNPTRVRKHLEPYQTLAGEEGHHILFEVKHPAEVLPRLSQRTSQKYYRSPYYSFISTDDSVHG